MFHILFNKSRPRQNGRHFPDDIFKWIFLSENVCIGLNELRGAMLYHHQMQMHKLQKMEILRNRLWYYILLQIPRARWTIFVPCSAIIDELVQGWNKVYRKTSNIRRTLVGNKLFITQM